MVDNQRYEPHHEALMKLLRRQGVFKAPGVEDAFQALPRHLFLPGIPLEKAFSNEAIPIKYDAGGMVVSSSSQPTMMAIMLDQMALAPGDNVLEIGTATGYNAALMQYIVGSQGHVTTIELDKDLSQQARRNLHAAGMPMVNVVHADGSLGYSPRASYDHIIVTAGAWDIPTPWLRQLKPKGRLIVPIWLDGVQVSAVFTAEDDGTYISTDNRPCAFVYLRGEAAGPDFRRRVGSSSLYLIGDEVDKVDTAALHLLLSDDYEMQRLESKLEPMDYWYGYQLFLMLNEPHKHIFVVYAVSEGQKAYGLEGRGIALLGPASASFAPYDELGVIHCFAGVDTFLLMQDRLDWWNKQGRPRAEQLRLRLIPRALGIPQGVPGKVYDRRDHYLHVWLSQKSR